ncbi:hypothetical protein COLO4_32885 [Corchorus olitorius]|uniref:Uncharacterized protein n=1 Tax=Corchorus olitorius TaxID=93759 RepID=A0A1R3GXN7_9ROSI|nr:hypothetical protein COLO4_32885 [Corchorus olitorius]
MADMSKGTLDSGKTQLFVLLTVLGGVLEFALYQHT